MAIRLKQLRNRQGYSQEGMAKSVGMTQKSWDRWESHPPEALDHLRAIARYYAVSSDYLLGLTEDPRPVATLQLNPETQNLVSQIIIDFSALSIRDQRMALDFLRMMRKAEAETSEPLVPRIIE